MVWIKHKAASLQIIMKKTRQGSINLSDTYESKINDSRLKRFHWDKISGRPFGGFIDICDDRWDPRWHICLQMLQTCFSIQAICSGKSARGMLGGGFVGRFSWLFYSTYVGRRVGEEGSSEIKQNSCDLHPRQLCTTRSDAGLEKDETDFPNTRIEMSDYFEKSSQRWIWFQLVARSLVVWLLDWSHPQSGTGGRWGFARRRKQHVDTVPKIERLIFCLQGQ